MFSVPLFAAVLTNVNIPNSANAKSFSVKVDQKIGIKHSVSARYFFGDSLQSAPAFVKTLAPPPPNPPELFNSVAPSRAQLAGATWTTLTEYSKLQFRWEVYDLLNRANFSSSISFNNNIQNSTFGTFSSTPDVDVFNPVVAQDGPRNMVFVIKFIF